MEISVDLLSAVSRWCHDDTRKHLNQVVIIQGEMRATDGHRLVRVPVKTPRGFVIGLMQYHLDKVCEIARVVGMSRVTLSQGSRGVTYDIGGIVSYVAPLGPVDDFPDAAKLDKVAPVTPLSSLPPSVAVNAQFLKDIVEIESALCHYHGIEEDPGVALVSWGDTTQALEFRSAYAKPAARYIVMPMRF